MFRSLSRSAVFLSLAAALLWTGCQSGLDEPAPVSPEAKTATAVLPSDTRVTMMIDVQESMTRGPASVREALSMSWTDEANTAGSAQLRDFLESVGFEPEKDLNRIYMAFSEQTETPYFVAYGTFSPERFQETIRSQHGDDVSETTYEGATVFVAKKGRGDARMAFSVVNEQMLIAAGSEPALQAMIDRQQSGGAALKDNTAQMRLIQDAAAGSSFWFVMRNVDGPNGDVPDGAGEAAQLAKVVQDVAGGGTFQENGSLDVQVTLTPVPGAAPSDVADLARGAIAAMKQSDRISDDTRSALNSASVDTRNGRVHVTTLLPAELVNKMDRKARG